MPRLPPGEAPLTPAERQARRREQFTRMREALKAIAETKSLKEAKAIAAEALGSNVQGSTTMEVPLDAWRRYRRLEAALCSIAENTCCDSCREAALVAKEALAG